MDPLIAAVIGKLPTSSTSWTPEHREAWLRMMTNAVDVVFGGPAGAPMARPQPQRSAPSTPAPAPRAPAQTPPARATSPATPAKAKPKKKKGGKRRTRVLQSSVRIEKMFIVDEQGFARDETGARILQGDVNNTIYDKRGEAGDLGAIVWADNTRGVAGYRFDIAAFSA